MEIKAFGTEAAEVPLKSMNIQRRTVTPHDVEIEILYCGICHSDLHAARNEWGGTIFPIVPSHEIVGRLSKQWAPMWWYSPLHFPKPKMPNDWEQMKWSYPLMPNR